MAMKHVEEVQALQVDKPITLSVPCLGDDRSIGVAERSFISHIIVRKSCLALWAI